MTLRYDGHTHNLHKLQSALCIHHWHFTLQGMTIVSTPLKFG